MKNLITLGAALALSITAASADTLFDPDFTSGSTTPPAGYSNGGYNTGSGNPGDPVTFHPQTGTIVYGTGTMTDSDFSQSAGLPYGTQAFITSTDPTPDSPSLNISFTFTPNYTYTGTSGTQINVPLLTLYTPGGNNNVLNVSMALSSFENNDMFSIGSGIQFGSPTVGNTVYRSNSAGSPYQSDGIQAFSGQTLTFNDVETFSHTPFDMNGNAVFTITNDATLSAGSTVLATFTTSTTEATVNGNYDPANNPLTLDVGQLSTDAGSGFLASGANIVFSNINISSAPEPSSYALLLGGLGLLVLMVRRTARA